MVGLPVMTDRHSSSPDAPAEESRVVNFPRRGGSAAGPGRAQPPVEDLSKYERGEEIDDYRHRMLVNVAALVLVAALIGAGLWLADTMASMRRDQDCVLSGRRGCAPVEVHSNRW
jgi:hypothetical protein